MKTKRIKKLEDHPAWLDAKGKLDALQGELTSLDHQESAIYQQLHSEASSDSLTREAEKMLAGENTEVYSQAGYKDDLDRILQRRRIIRKAIEIQRKNLEAIHNQVCTEACTGAYPEYAVLVRGVADAATVLEAAIRKERVFMGELEAGGIFVDPTILPCAVIPGLASKVDSLLRLARESRYI